MSTIGEGGGDVNKFTITQQTTTETSKTGKTKTGPYDDQVEKSSQTPKDSNYTQDSDKPKLNQPDYDGITKHELNKKNDSGSNVNKNSFKKSSGGKSTKKETSPLTKSEEKVYAKLNALSGGELDGKLKELGMSKKEYVAKITEQLKNENPGKSTGKALDASSDLLNKTTIDLNDKVEAKTLKTYTPGEISVEKHLNKLLDGKLDDFLDALGVDKKEFLKGITQQMKAEGLTITDVSSDKASPLFKKVTTKLEKQIDTHPTASKQVFLTSSEKKMKAQLNDLMGGQFSATLDKLGWSENEYIQFISENMQGLSGEEMGIGLQMRADELEIAEELNNIPGFEGELSDILDKGDGSILSYLSAVRQTLSDAEDPKAVMDSFKDDIKTMAKNQKLRAKFNSAMKKTLDNNPKLKEFGGSFEAIAYALGENPSAFYEKLASLPEGEQDAFIEKTIGQLTEKAKTTSPTSNKVIENMLNSGPELHGNLDKTLKTLGLDKQAFLKGLGLVVKGAGKTTISHKDFLQFVQWALKALSDVKQLAMQMENKTLSVKEELNISQAKDFISVLESMNKKAIDAIKGAKATTTAIGWIAFGAAMMALAIAVAAVVVAVSVIVAVATAGVGTVFVVLAVIGLIGAVVGFVSAVIGAVSATVVVAGGHPEGVIGWFLEDVLGIEDEDTRMVIQLVLAGSVALFCGVCGIAGALAGFGGLVGAASAGIQVASVGVKAGVKAAVETLKAALKAIVQSIKAMAKAVVEFVKALVKASLKGMMAALKAFVIAAVKTGGAIIKVFAAFKKMFMAITGPLRKVFAPLKKIMDPLMEGVTKGSGAFGSLGGNAALQSVAKQTLKEIKPDATEEDEQMLDTILMITQIILGLLAMLGGSGGKTGAAAVKATAKVASGATQAGKLMTGVAKVVNGISAVQKFAKIQTLVMLGQAGSTMARTVAAGFQYRDAKRKTDVDKERAKIEGIRTQRESTKAMGKAAITSLEQLSKEAVDLEKFFADFMKKLSKSANVAASAGRG